ncbi:MAG: hypothetical protein IJ770_02320 [Alphaproteobacteria bacterium]|nr:hypothetical protein [Alphaproteobacteria bacterium]
MTKKYLEFEQDGVKYNLYDMPKGFVVKGNLDLRGKDLTELPDLSDVVVEGNFYCSMNQLTTLKGAPQKVGGHFCCSYNKLTTLKSAPLEVGGDFRCYDNQLITLEGAPKEVGRHFDCFENQLTTLEGAPQKVGRVFNCSVNKLTTLEGAPQKVGGDFKCSDNQLTTLEGAPREVGGDFKCSDNQLTTLEGAPEKVGGVFWCNGNRLKSLLHLPIMQAKRAINCDDELAQKYGISKGEFTANELNESSVYQNEVKIYKLRLQKSQERAEREDKAVADIKARFAAWQAQQAQKDGPEK